VILLLLVAQLALGYAGMVNTGGVEHYIKERADFRAILTGALTIYEGNGHLLYDEATERAYQARILAPFQFEQPERVLPNSHPPFESLLIAPLMAQPYAVPFALWTAIEVAAMVAALCLLARAAPVSAPTRWLLIGGALAYQPFHAVLWTGQSSPLILLGLCGIYAAIQGRRPWWAGAALALVLLKPQLGVAVVLLLVLGRCWQTLLAATGIWAVASVAIMPIIGLDWPLRYARYLLGSAAWGEEHFEFIPGMYNWRGFAENLLGTRFPGLVGPAAMVLILVTVAMIVWVWWRSGRSIRGAAATPAWIVVGIASILIPQHLYPHDLTILIFPAWLLLFAIAAGNWPVISPLVWRGLIVLGFVLPLLIFLFAARTSQAVLPTVILLASILGLVAYTVQRRSPVDQH
jgi:hypothetical protein